MDERHEKGPAGGPGAARSDTVVEAGPADQVDEGGPGLAHDKAAQEDLAEFRESWTRQVRESSLALILAAVWGWFTLTILTAAAARRGDGLSQAEPLGVFDLPWQLGIADQDAYVIATALLVLVATLGVAVVASGLNPAGHPRDDVELHLWARLISIVARLAALGALVVGLSRSDAPVPFIGLTGVGLLAVLISSAIVQRETDQVGWRLRMLGLSKQQADLEHALARTGVDGKECPTRRELIKDWVYLIAGVVASCGASIAIAVVIYVAGPGEHQDLRDPEIISAVLSSTGLVAVTWALTVVIGYRGRVRNAKPWGAVLEVIAYSFAVLTTALLGGVVLSSWTDDWFWMVMMGVTAAVGSSLGYLGVRGRGPYRVARTSAIAAIHRDLAQVSASLSDVGNRIRQTPTSGVEPRLDPGLTKSPAAGQGTI